MIDFHLMKIFIFLCFHEHINSQLIHFSSIFKNSNFRVLQKICYSFVQFINFGKPFLQAAWFETVSIYQFLEMSRIHGVFRNRLLEAARYPVLDRSTSRGALATCIEAYQPPLKMFFLVLFPSQDLFIHPNPHGTLNPSQPMQIEVHYQSGAKQAPKRIRGEEEHFDL